MKKILSFVLFFGLLLALSSFCMAAATIGGNIRIWYKDSDNGAATNASNSTFCFDRLSLSVKADLTPNSGVNGGIQFAQIGKNGYDPNAKSNKVDIRIENANYFQKGLFFTNDELDAGYFKLPFFNEKDYQAILLDSLGALAIGNAKKSVGLKYMGKMDTFEYALAIVNASNGTNYNSPSASEGFDTAVRLAYNPVKNLKFGLGYVNNVTTSTKTSANASTIGVIDTTYGIGPFGIFLEYVSLTPESKDPLTGIYCETKIQITPTFNIYGGRAVSVSDGGNNGKNLTEYLGTSDNNYIEGTSGSTTDYDFVVNDNWTIIGAKYQFAEKTALQGEFLRQDESSGSDAKWIFGLRLIAEF